MEVTDCDISSRSYQRDISVSLDMLLSTPTLKDDEDNFRSSPASPWPCSVQLVLAVKQCDH